jgi:hypothetical protein
VEQPCEDLLAGSAFSLQQHRNGGIGNALKLIPGGSHKGGFSKDHFGGREVTDIDIIARAGQRRFLCTEGDLNSV